MSLSNVARASRRGFLAAVALCALAAFPAAAQMLVEGQDYTLEALGVEEKLTPEVFVALHDRKTPLYQDKAFFDWAASKGLDRKKVEDTYNSFGVTSKFNRSRAIAKDYNVQSVPLVIVDGRFQLSSDKVGSHAAMPAAINQLITKARAERPKS